MRFIRQISAVFSLRLTGSFNAQGAAVISRPPPYKKGDGAIHRKSRHNEICDLCVSGEKGLHEIELASHNLLIYNSIRSQLFILLKNIPIDQTNSFSK